MIFSIVSQFIRQHIRTLELVGVMMRITSFTLVSWMGPKSPFLFVWCFNTLDAILLSWCSLLRRDLAYSMLNLFWIGVGALGIARAMGWV